MRLEPTSWGSAPSPAWCPPVAGSYGDLISPPLLERHGVVREIALDLVRPDGVRIPVLLNAGVQDPDAGGFLVVVLETRDRHRYEDHLLAAKHAAELAGEQAASLAATLQGTLIPPHPPAIPHLDIQALYRPAGSGREVGGDFYDVLQVGPDAWLVVLGDVSGKGIPAAVVTSFVRYTIRSFAIAYPDPADLLGALDEAIRRTAPTTSAPWSPSASSGWTRAGTWRWRSPVIRRHWSVGRTARRTSWVCPARRSA